MDFGNSIEGKHYSTDRDMLCSFLRVFFAENRRETRRIPLRTQEGSLWNEELQRGKHRPPDQTHLHTYRSELDYRGMLWKALVGRVQCKRRLLNT